MYQDVDAIEETGDKPAARQGVTRLKISVVILLGMALLLGAILFSGNSKPIATVDADIEAAQYADYAKALSERDPALRRARLVDFIENYPRHDRVSAAKAQLDVINAADDRDWASLTDVIYNPANSRPVKLAAIDLYEDLWGSHLLGSRETDIADLRDKVKEKEPPEDPEIATRIDFTPRTDKFDKSIDGSQMAGGIVVPERSYIPPTDTVEIIRPLVRPQRPRIRKNVKARYPSRALRRGVEADIVLALSIDERGETQMTEVVSVNASRYKKDFIKAAERAAMRTIFYPAMLDGRPVPASGVVKTYKFRIED
ncbi:MAG: hypothetical protein HKN36_10985 [Hellea sp.]|nr:hypothetical protein [Hellea sp.]